MLLNSFVGVIYQGLRKVCATSGPCISTRTWFVLNGSPCLIELTRCGRKTNQPSSIAEKTAKTEKTAGISYVAISRVKTLCSCIIEPMTFERLKGLRNSTNLKYRLEEEKKLDELAQDTCRNLIKK